MAIVAVENELDAAVSEGRGVVLAAPHLFAHELVAGLIHLRHQVAMLIRESSNSHKHAMKQRWYKALQLKTIPLPRDSSPAVTLMQCVDALQDGYVLGITPDLICTSPHSVPVRLFDRKVGVHPGLIAIAMYSRAPLVTCYGAIDHHGHSELEFTEPRHYASPNGKQRKLNGVDDVIAAGMQDWFDAFERFIHRYPETWMFWLDKRWANVIRSQAPIRKAA